MFYPTLFPHQKAFLQILFFLPITGTVVSSTVGTLTTALTTAPTTAHTDLIKKSVSDALSVYELGLSTAQITAASDTAVSLIATAISDSLKKENAIAGTITVTAPATTTTIVKPQPAPSLSRATNNVRLAVLNLFSDDQLIDFIGAIAININSALILSTWGRFAGWWKNLFSKKKKNASLSPTADTGDEIDFNMFFIESVVSAGGINGGVGVGGLMSGGSKPISPEDQQKLDKLHKDIELFTAAIKTTQIDRSRDSFKLMLVSAKKQYNDIIDKKGYNLTKYTI